jgi:hypothetical protein
MTKLNTAALLPLVGKLGVLLRSGLDRYIEMRSMGIEPNADIIALYLTTQMETWDPVVQGKHLLDPETRTACARFLGGVVFNFATPSPSPEVEASP